MNTELRGLVHDKLKQDSLLKEGWSGLVLAACDGREQVESHLTGGEGGLSTPDTAPSTAPAAAYLTSLTVQGFRGIGPKQSLTFNPGPGLTIIIGRNGSGKSSFAEAMEVLFTGDSKRWADRSKIWKEGWRNLHQPHPTTIDAELLIEGHGPLKVSCRWSQEAGLGEQEEFAQLRGKAKTSIDGLGWSEALVSYRPFLSYNELGSMLDEGPSKLYDALSLALGLEDLVNAQAALSQARLERQKSIDGVNATRETLVEQLTELLKPGPDERASTCLAALAAKSWDVDAIAAVLATASSSSPDQDISALNRAAALETVDPALVDGAIAALLKSEQRLQAFQGGDAETSRQIAILLQAALDFHSTHGDCNCPVCGKKAGLSESWAESSRKEVARLQRIAAESTEAHRAAEDASRKARALLVAPPRLLSQLPDLKGLAEARKQWELWYAGATSKDRLVLANHLETSHKVFSQAIESLRVSAAAELKRREDRWRPIATGLADWLGSARPAQQAAASIPSLKKADAWLKDASGSIRDDRFAPIADRAMATWEHLRQQSNVALGRIELTGKGNTRRVSLDVTVDGIPGAALGVMSQGELHSLALSLFLPRATLSSSPFRFVVIDDPVQSMDPSRIDGLARALEETAQTRQVIVFTHDERLPEAVRRLAIKSTVFSVTRRPKSVVEVRPALDPVQAYIQDALALFHTTDLPDKVVRRLVPGFCRSALEASFITVIRRRRLAAGRLHNEVEEELHGAGKLNPLAALALFDDKSRSGDVMSRLNQWGPWAADVFRQCKDGPHVEVEGDLQFMIRSAEKLAAHVLELK